MFSIYFLLFFIKILKGENGLYQILALLKILCFCAFVPDHISFVPRQKKDNTGNPILSFNLHYFSV